MPAPPQTLFYVAPDGAATGAGTINSPLDITTALTHPDIGAGHTVILTAGNYDIGELMLQASVSGEDGNPVTIKNQPGDAVRLYFGIRTTGANQTWLSEDYNLLIEPNDPVRLWHLEDNPQIGFWMGADNLRLINIRINNVIGSGIIGHNQKNITTYGCVVTRCGYWETDAQGVIIDAHGPPLYMPQAYDDISVTHELNVMLGCVKPLQIGDGGGVDHTYNMTLKNMTISSFFSGSSYVHDVTLDGVWAYSDQITFGLYYTGGTNGYVEVMNGYFDNSQSVINNTRSFRIVNYDESYVHDNQFAVENYLIEGDGTHNIQTMTAATGKVSQCLVNAHAPGFSVIRAKDYDASVDDISNEITIDVSALAVSGTARLYNPLLWSEYHDYTIIGGTITVDMVGWTNPPYTGHTSVESPTIINARNAVWIAKIL